MKIRTMVEGIGDALRRRREGKGVSQEAFADEIGMHRTYYSALERGESNLTVGTLSRVCAGLGARVWDVMRDAEVSGAVAEPAPKGYRRKSTRRARSDAPPGGKAE